MADTVQPRVFWIGSTALDYESLRAYLEHTGQADYLQSVTAAKEAGLTDLEILCATEAKLCYKSLVLGKNDNVSRLRDIPDNFKNILKQGHGSVLEHATLNFLISNCSRVFCYAPGTEIYTYTGWKLIETLSTRDVLMTMSPATRLARWSPIEEMYVFEYDGDLLFWENAQMCSPGMTPEHLLWAAPHGARQARELSPEENVATYSKKVAFEDVFGTPFVVDCGIRWQDAAEGRRSSQLSAQLDSWMVKGAAVVTAAAQHRTPYCGKVYCPRTVDGLVYVRHRGLAFWCANTHELVRHRAGTAFSQTSGRYCRLDHIDLVWDPALDPVRALLLDHTKRTEDVVYLAECALGLRKPPPAHPDTLPSTCLDLRDALRRPGGSLSPEDLKWVPDNSFDFTKRKELTNAIRYIAPNGQANEIGLSINVRALRHTVQLRTARFASREIRLVFGQIYELVKAKHPLVFADAKEFRYNGLLEVSGMKQQPYEIDAGDPEALCFYTSEQLAVELDRRTAENAAAEAARPKS